MMEQDIAYGINVVRHKYSNNPNCKEKSLFLKFCKKCSRSGHSISTCPKPLDKTSFQKQLFNQAMKGNKNLPNKQVTSNKILTILTIKSARANSHNLTRNLKTLIAILNHPVEVVHHTQDHQILWTTLTITLDHGHLTKIGMEFVQDNHSHVINFVTSENILTNFQIRNQQTAQLLTLKIRTHKMSRRKHSSNNSLMT